MSGGLGFHALPHPVSASQPLPGQAEDCSAVTPRAADEAVPLLGHLYGKGESFRPVDGE